MMKHQRYHQLQKGGEKQEEEEEESPHIILMECKNTSYKKTRPNLIHLLFLFCFFYCSLFIAFRLFDCSSTLPFFFYFAKEPGLFIATEARESTSSSLPCSSILNGSIWCDRTGFRSDICYMKGDIRTSSATSSIFLYSSNNSNGDTVPLSSSKEEVVERIRPYTRKWETSIMEIIDELRLITRNTDSGILNTCQVRHSVPAIFFSTGGYTGNVYHEFNDGILPLYITSQRYNHSVIFVILDYHNWWITKYGDILARLSDYPPIDFTHDRTVHCFPEAIVGLQIHDELTVTSLLMTNNQTIQDFRSLLDKAYEPRIRGIIKEEESQANVSSVDDLYMIMNKPRLVILSRNGSRAIMNERDIVELAEEIGFHVEVMRPTPSTELAKIYRVLNSSDAMVGVHGAAMTHLLFMRPGSVFIQVVPLGTDWAAHTFYGEPAIKLGLKYIGYRILPRESSLYGEYERDDPVLKDSKSVTKKGWQETKRVYLDRQNVRLDLSRFKKRLVYAYEHSMAKRRWR